MKKIIYFMVALLAGLLCLQRPSYAITREQVIETAAAYANLTWVCSKKNAKKSYNVLHPGKQYRGVPYNWGGFDSPDTFLQKVKRGKVAGNYKKKCGRKLCVRSDFAGLDCSGLVSRSWEINRYTTQTLPAISIKIPWDLLQPGDILNSRNKHVMLFDKFDEENQIWVYEASVWVRNGKTPPAGVVYRAVDMDEEYTPRRYYQFIEEGERVKSDRRIAVLDQLQGKKKFYIIAGIQGQIVKAPVVRHAAKKTKAFADVWVCVKFENGKEGWAPIRHLSLIGSTADQPKEASQVISKEPSASLSHDNKTVRKTS